MVSMYSETVPLYFRMYAIAVTAGVTSKMTIKMAWNIISTHLFKLQPNEAEKLAILFVIRVNCSVRMFRNN
jgi:hypothetical protein